MEWNDPPAMETGAPEPELKEIGGSLLCAYRCSNPDFPGWDSGESIEHPGFTEYFAVLEFTDVKRFFMGPPSDESLYDHHLHKLGVDYYSFNKLETSPELSDPDNNEYCHWVVTFHDETLQVIAKNATVKSRRIDAGSAKEALELVGK